MKDEHLFISIDGTDCRIKEPIPFSKKWFSHKFKSAGLRYEVGVSIKLGHIVWVNGPFPCGSYPDGNSFNNGIKQYLDINENVISDKGYSSSACVTEHSINGNTKFLKRILARHETVNKRIKQFKVVSNKFRHNKRLHSVCFHSAAQLTQKMIETSDPIFPL